MQQASARRIDIHAHLLDRPYLEALTRRLGLAATRTETGQTFLRQGGTTVAWYRDGFFDPASRVAEMDRAGVATRIVSVSSPGVNPWQGAEQVAMARHLNDAAAALCRAAPGRFAGLVTLPLDDVPAAIAELKRGVEELGLVGAAMGSHAGGRPMNHPDLEPLWAELDRRRLPVVEHPSQPLGAAHMDEFELPIRLGFVYETTTALTRMIYAGVFERHPHIPFVVAHTGGALLTLLERLDNGYRIFPDCRRHISRLPSEYARGLFYDSCAFQPEVLLLARGIVGAERILWGSDDPFIGASAAHVADLPLPEAERAAMLGGNAARLFGPEGGA